MKRAWHYYTDTYKGRFHHLIVDSVLSMCLVSILAINFAIGIWLYLFFIPPQFEASVELPQVVISGGKLPVEIHYQNIGKGIGNVELALYSPEGYVTEKNTTFYYKTLDENE